MRALFSLLALAALVGTARADEPPPPAIGPWVGAAIRPAGRGDIAVVHEVALSTFLIHPDELGTANTSGLDLAYGLTPRLTVGLSHSARALGTVDRGLGWCHEGGSHLCRAAYAGSMVDARWLAHRDAAGRFTVAALARAGVLGTGPLLPAVRLGVSVRGARGRLWLAAEPEVQIALGHRELGNRDTLVAPLWLGVGRRRAAAWLATGLRGGLVDFGDKWELPFVLGGAIAVGPARAGIEAGFPRLVGPQNTGNVRHAALWLAFSF